MTMTRNNPEQRGVVLLLILLILVVAGSTLALSALNSNPAQRAQQQRDLHQQMQRAKEALLAYAAHSATLHGNTRGPGFFPGPDTTASDPDENGIVSDDSTTDCSGYDSTTRALVGRLPVALDIPSGRYELNAYDSGIDQQFWYSVGNRYVSISSATATTSVLRNSVRRTSASLADATNYRLTLDGTPGYVAMIIAPGESLATQNRPDAPGSHNNYIDQINGDAFAFISRLPAVPAALNDQLLGITLDEYMRAVGIQVIVAMKNQLDAYYVINGNQYPASPGYTDFPLEPSVPGSQDEFQEVFYIAGAGSPAWLRSDAAIPPDQGNGENWPSFTHYQQLSNSQARLVFAGCAGMIYTVDYTGGIARSGDSC
jgi:hypothetical protein